jgi:hypothetical protein
MVTRWYCSECDDVCDQRPFVKFYLHGRKTALGLGKQGRPEEGEWRCVQCQHIPKLHTFTFLLPKMRRE